ncbi:NAD(P)H-dependent oxidoreductase [Paraglaciecola aquimarina]|uniref:NAD(P)H-dependent oxidoreductase n=1 Tax=Paraglaciecola aquimarina TaxID=1235557 RepID=A0ABU3SRR4_9ALTE|nr:NAD(P)H-dependent oxidoreductase [Paraglaciecola aquimarina]MDU0352679.1 NAD(P)H-dependent oxidoreductase [Paraglaciecola aquimarina]
MNILAALNWRYAVKSFSDRQVGQQQLDDLLNATRLSASSYGLQPYKILVVSAKKRREQLLPYSFGQEKIVHCSHLIILAAEKKIGDQTVDRFIAKYAQINNKPVEDLAKFSDHMKSALAAKSLLQKQEWAHQQAYIALGTLLTSAASMQIDTCPMTGFESKGYDQVLGLDQLGLTSSVICPIGYRDQEDPQATLTKVRFDFNELVLEL